MIDEAAIRLRWDTVGSGLDERGRRLFAAAEVRSAGRGGLAAVANITGLARSTINRGKKDLDGRPLPKGRVRRAGGGRRALCENDPGLIPALKRLVEPATLGDPMRPLIWVSKSVEKLAATLETLRQVAEPDRIVHHCRCTGCGARSRASFPDEVKAPVQYGPRIAAVVIYLLHYQLLPEDRLAELMADLFGIRLVAATIARMSRTCAARLQDFVTAVRDLVAGAPVKHMDETGFRIGGQTQWLHVACTAWLTFYRVCAKRGSLLADVVGIVVHDHWKPYYTMTGVLQALCNAHHLRELKALVEIEKEDWARKMQQLLRR